MKITFVLLALASAACINNKSTPNRAQQYYHKTAIGSSDAVTFNVKARNDAHFGFIDRNGRDYYEIALSGWGNRHTKIRRGLIGDNLRAGRKWDKVGANTRGYLHGNRGRDFWASAANGYVRVGRGKKFGQSLIAEWIDSRPLDITHFAVMTGWGASGVWSVCDIATSVGNCVDVKTQNQAQQYRHRTPLSSSDAVTFQVKAKNDAHFGFIDANGRDYYEIALSGWGNRHTKIRRGQISQNTLRAGRKWDKVGRGTNGYLHRNQFRSFWASAKNGLVKIGKGRTLNQQTFLSWQDRSPLNPKYFAVMTGWGSSGHWKVCNALDATKAPTNQPTPAPTPYPTHHCPVTCNLQNTHSKCSGNKQITKTFNYFNTGTAKGCEHRHHYLYDYKGSDCIWTSTAQAITHPHGFDKLFTTFKMAEYGNLEDNDFLKVQLQLGDANKKFGRWYETVKLQDDVLGWRWTTVKGAPVNGKFNGRSDWKNTAVAIGMRDRFVKIRIQLRSSQNYAERHIADAMTVWASCSTSAPGKAIKVTHNRAKMHGLNYNIKHRCYHAGGQCKCLCM